MELDLSNNELKLFHETLVAADEILDFHGDYLDNQYVLHKVIDLVEEELKQ